MAEAPNGPALISDFANIPKAESQLDSPPTIAGADAVDVS